MMWQIQWAHIQSSHKYIQNYMLFRICGFEWGILATGRPWQYDLIYVAIPITTIPQLYSIHHCFAICKRPYPKTMILHDSRILMDIVYNPIEKYHEENPTCILLKLGLSLCIPLYIWLYIYIHVYSLTDLF